MNKFFADSFNCFNNITIGENIPGKFVTQTFKTSPTYNTGDFPDISFTTDIKKTVELCIIAQISRDDNIIITSPVSVQWSYTNKQVSIDYISGLTNSITYTVRFLIL